VQVHHDRIDPESCAAACEGSSEALTGERTGQPLSRESTFSPGADVSAEPTLMDVQRNLGPVVVGSFEIRQSLNTISPPR
jgi:hypothetical protein